MAIVLTAVGLPVDDIRLIGSCKYNNTIRWSCKLTIVVRAVGLSVDDIRLIIAIGWFL